MEFEMVGRYTGSLDAIAACWVILYSKDEDQGMN